MSLRLQARRSGLAVPGRPLAMGIAMGIVLGAALGAVYAGGCT